MDLVPNGCTSEYEEISLQDLLAIIRRRWGTILFCILVSLGTAAAYLYLSPEVYKLSNTIVLGQAGNLDMKDVFLFLGDDNLLMKMKSQDQGLDKDVLDKILEIKAAPFKKKGLENERALQVDVLAVDKKAGISFIKYLPQYIQTRPLIVNKVENYKRYMRKNISDLQSFRDNPIKALRITGNPIITPDFYSIYELYNRYTEILEKLERFQIVTLAGDTYLPLKPYKPKKALIILASIFFGLVIGLCFAFVMERPERPPHTDDSALEDPKPSRDGTGPLIG